MQLPILAPASIGICLSMLVLAACTTLKEVPTTHIVMVNGRGNPVDPTGNILCRGKPETCRTPDGESYHLWGFPVEYRQMGRTSSPPASSFPASAGSMGQVPNSYDKCLDALFKDLLEKAPTRDARRQILFFAHGGLNTQVGTVERVSELIQEIPKEDYYPIFVNWQSSLFSSYADHLFYVRQGESWDTWGWILPPFYFASDVARAVARAPIV